MHPKDLKWFEPRNVDEAAGTIYFQHRRLLLFDADAMGLPHKELLETRGLERARRILNGGLRARGFMGQRSVLVDESTCTRGGTMDKRREDEPRVT